VSRTVMWPLPYTGFFWQRWLALSKSKRWNEVYLCATGGRDEPRWEWGREQRGSWGGQFGKG
jgi:hypothetical protein